MNIAVTIHLNAKAFELSGYVSVTIIFKNYPETYSEFYSENHSDLSPLMSGNFNYSFMYSHRHLFKANF